MQWRLATRWLSSFFVAVLLSGSAARGQDKPTSIFTMNLDGSVVRKIAHVPGYAEHGGPRWSHDGKRIAFDAVPAGGGMRTMFVANADGSGLVQVGQGAFPTWSPDDKQLICHLWPLGGLSQLFVQNIDGQGRSALGIGNSPQFSPNGALVAMTDRKNVFLVDFVTGEATALFDQPFDEVFKGLDFSPDGKRLAAAVRPAAGAVRQLMIVGTEGAAKRATVRLKAGLGGFVSFSPDGKQLVFSDEYQLRIVDVDGNAPPKLIPLQKGNNTCPDWSPDGKSLVFVSDRDEK